MESSFDETALPGFESSFDETALPDFESSFDETALPDFESSFEKTALLGFESTFASVDFRLAFLGWLKLADFDLNFDFVDAAPIAADKLPVVKYGSKAASAITLRRRYLEPGLFITSLR
ncbi:MAG: hypothetical protein U0103_09460 [Candidatus Obscuribacterales bacterium]|nr:hypothetical protein [Cyanobacteria bacterium SZAS LIN-5]